MQTWKIHAAWAVVLVLVCGAWGRWCASRAEPGAPAGGTSVPSPVDDPQGPKPPAEKPRASASIPAAPPEPGSAGHGEAPAYTFDAPSLEEIRRLIRSGARSDQARAGSAIEKLKDPKLRRELLLELSNTNEDDFRYQALIYLIAYRDPEVLSRLQQALASDRHPGIRQEMARALGKLGGDGTVELLFRVAADSNLALRVPVAAALNKLGHPGPAAELVPVFTPGLDDPDGAARYSAVHNLSGLQSVVAMPALIRATQDRSGEVRQAAARGLGDLGNADAIPVLERLLKDPVSDVAEAAKDSLEQLRPK